MWYKETLESILKKAIDKEKDAYTVYKEVADNTKNEKVKAVLNALAEKEQKHIQVIEDFDMKMLKKQEIEINETCRQWIAEYFISSDETLGSDSEFKDVFMYAAKREKKSFEFYSCMSKLVDDPKLKKLFSWLAQEESKHEKDLIWDLMYR